jgi:hypothetical protein
MCPVAANEWVWFQLRQHHILTTSKVKTKSGIYLTRAHAHHIDKDTVMKEDNHHLNDNDFSFEKKKQGVKDRLKRSWSLRKEEGRRAEPRMHCIYCTGQAVTFVSSFVLSILVSFSVNPIHVLLSSP